MKFLFFTALMCFALSINTFSQTKTDFSGQWTLDVENSDYGDDLQIGSMTIKVTQTSDNIKIITEIKRKNITGGRGRPDLGPTINVYTLDGKETTGEETVYAGTKGLVRLTASFATDGTLNLQKVTEWPGSGSKATVKEVWSLSNGGKTLTIKNESSNSRSGNAEFVMKKL